MNFLMLRSNSRATNQDENSVEESEMDRHYSPRKGAMFQGPISQDKTNDDCRDLDNSSYSRVDISEDDGLIIIPYSYDLCFALFTQFNLHARLFRFFFSVFEKLLSFSQNKFLTIGVRRQIYSLIAPLIAILYLPVTVSLFLLAP